MDWTSEKRLELIAALAVHRMNHISTEPWTALMGRILYLATWPDYLLEANIQNFEDAIKSLEDATDETD